MPADVEHGSHGYSTNEITPPILIFSNNMTAVKQPISMIKCCFLFLQINENAFAKNSVIQNHIGIHIGRAIEGLRMTIPNIGLVIYSFMEKGMLVF